MVILEIEHFHHHPSYCDKACQHPFTPLSNYRKKGECFEENKKGAIFACNLKI